MADFKIDLTEEFPHLNQAPIVEAVIEVLARAGVALEEQSLTEELKRKLPDYSVPVRQQEIEFTTKFSADKQPEHAVREPIWKGMLVHSADNRYVGQFNRDGFIFSRLPPYENWNKFSSEALRLWQIYSELARPLEGRRLGLRYINRLMIPVQGKTVLEDYLRTPPCRPYGLPVEFASFMHNDFFKVPDHPYGARILQMIEPSPNPGASEVGLILDIDAFTVYPFDVDKVDLPNILANLRWLKNKIFFGIIAEQRLEKLK
jgi:uncharacterized protein (TIGR04255 family)